MTAKTALHLLCDKYRNRLFASDAVNWAIRELVEGRDSDALPCSVVRFNSWRGHFDDDAVHEQTRGQESLGLKPIFAR
jgi:hypothetical protein